MRKDRLIKEMLDLVSDFDDNNREKVGELPKEIHDIYKEYEGKDELLTHLIDLKKKEYEAKFNQMIYAEYGEQIQANREIRDRFWNAVYEHFNVDDSDAYHLDGKTVYRELKGDKKKENSDLH